jgi:hypothetical protein
MTMPNTKRVVERSGGPLIILALIMGYGLFNALAHMVTDSRLWRDVTHQTPFRDVRITRVTATALEITTTGSLVKDRDCSTFGAPIAQVLKDGLLRPAKFISREGEDTPASRAADSRRQSFGPWVIVSPVPWPDRAVMHRQHLCGNVVQTNRVFDIAWPPEE